MKRSWLFLFLLAFQGDSLAGDAMIDRFGGFLAVKREATGFFRVAQIADRWCFITPEGHPYIALGGNHVGSYLKQQAAEGGLLARHGNDAEKAADALLEQMRAMGLNAGDAYQPVSRFAERIPWVASVSYLPDGKKGWPVVFDEAEMQTMHGHVRQACESFAGNPWVLGITGPDLPQWDSTRVNAYRHAAPGSAARKGYESFLRDRATGRIEAVNTVYGTRFGSWEDLAAKQKLGSFDLATDAARAGDEAFLSLVAEKHFRAFRAAVKAGAPHHLFFGERTQLRTIPDGVLRAVGREVDVFCTQALIRLPKNPPDWQVFQRPFYDHEFTLVNKPMIIIDWAAPFTMGDTAEQTPYGLLKPEPEAARDAGQFVIDAFEPPYMIGIFICQMIGTHPNDRFFTRAKRTYLQDDGQPMNHRAEHLRTAFKEVHEKLLPRWR